MFTLTSEIVMSVRQIRTRSLLHADRSQCMSGQSASFDGYNN